MKKIIDWFKDLFYNITDYALILCVIVVIAAILIWRFNILFNLSVEKDSIAQETPNIEITDNLNNENQNDINNENQDNEQSNDDNNNPTDTSTNNQEQENNEGNEDNEESDNQENQDSDNSNNDSSNNSENTGDEESTEITFNIPSGSFPNKIAEILLENGLIDDKTVFLNRCSELKLDTKLKAGDFTIKKGTSLDEIIKTLAK